MTNPKRVPDLFYDLYCHAKERGLDDDAAAWDADLRLQQLAEEPTLPHKEQNDGR